jgi:hypothetical protein
VTRRYRNRTYPVIGWAVVALLACVIVALAAFGQFIAAFAAALASVPLTWLAYRAYIRTAVETGEAGILVLNPFRTIRLRWDEIDRISAGMKLMISTRDGGIVEAWAVQAANIARMTGRRSYADRVADELNQQLAESRGDRSPVVGNPSYGSSASDRGKVRRAALQTGVTGLLVIGFVVLRELS